MRADRLFAMISSTLVLRLVSCATTADDTPSSRSSTSGNGQSSNPNDDDSTGSSQPPGSAGALDGGNASQEPDESAPDLSIPEDAAIDPNACEGLECQQTTCLDGPCSQAACEEGLSTTVSGIVHDPSGKLPLYNVTVYVPNGEVRQFSEGPSCDSCALTAEKPLSAAITNASGEFELDDVPVGEEIPLVVQSASGVGKPRSGWIRAWTIRLLPIRRDCHAIRAKETSR